jgi:uncharacterized protein YbjT (DUF2867 family)
VSALGAKVRRGDLEDLDGLMEAAADSDGVIHLTLRVRNVVETAVIDLAQRRRSSVVRIANIAHSTTDSAGFLPTLIALAKEKGVAGYPGDSANLWNAVHIRDVASVFRLALENGPAGKHWHAVQDEDIPVREIAEAIGGRLGLPAVSIPLEELMLPGYFGFLAKHRHAELPGVQPHHPPHPRLGTRSARPARRYGQRPLLPRQLMDRNGSGTYQTIRLF